MTVLIDIQNVSFQYPHSSSPVLNEISLQVSKGEWVAVAGRNGSGKSTLARLLNAQLQPTSGAIYLAGEPMADPAFERNHRRRCGYVFQNPDHQFIGATVWDDLAFGLENHSIERTEMVARMNKYLKVLHLEDLVDKAPHQLSGGQKQRVGLAGMMVLEPDVIILDEATSMLDPKGRRDVMQALTEIANQGVTIIMITHDMEEVLQAERLLLIDQGRVVADGDPFHVFEQNQLLEQTGLKRPFVVELQQELKRTGLQLEGRCYSEGELVKRLCNLPLIK